MKWFKESDFACKCGCGLLPKQEIMTLADRVRESFGAPLTVASGARCMSHTLALRAQGIPAALHSAHLEGLAVDLHSEHMQAFHDHCLKNLIRWDCWMEDPKATPLWAHLQTRPVSGKRAFKP